jgi:hypothetical protein
MDRGLTFLALDYLFSQQIASFSPLTSGKEIAINDKVMLSV